MTKTNRIKVPAVVAAALVLCLLALVMVRPAEAAFPGKDGKIAFQRGTKVWMKNPSLGAPETKLLDETTADSQASFSPDGSRVAFMRANEIYVARADGTGTPVKLTTNCVLDSHPAWSHDGTRIVFVRRSSADPNSCSGQYNIWTMNADGTNPVQLTTDGLKDAPAWSVPVPDVAPDGKIVYRHSSSQLWTMDPDGTDKTRLSYSCPNENGGICDTSVGIPTFSPDGTKIAFDYSGDIYWTYTSGVDPDTGLTPIAYPILRDRKGTETTVDDTEYPGDEGEAAWSPDGTKIAFQHNDIGGNSFYDIYIANADGSSTVPTQITSLGGLNPDWQPNSAPTITRVRPANGSETTDRTPLIAATVSDKQTDLARANITLSLDGEVIPRTAFSYKRSTDRLSYTPATALSFGMHTVSIAARDEVGLRSTKEWTFRVVR